MNSEFNNLLFERKRSVGHGLVERFLRDDLRRINGPRDSLGTPLIDIGDAWDWRRVRCRGLDFADLEMPTAHLQHPQRPQQSAGATRVMEGHLGMEDTWNQRA